MSPTDHDLTDPEAPAPAPELRSYGRRRGRKLSPRQERLMAELLPRVAPRLDANPAVALPALIHACAQMWLEIGFGGGEHLLWQARHNPHVRIIGAEPFEDGVVKVLTAIEDEGLGNILVHADDARALLRWLPPASLSRVFILFPDPWPKRRHLKRRLVNAHLLGMLARVMRSGAELRIGTDIGDYARTILMAFRQSPDFVWCAERPADWRDRPEDWPPTRYEQKAGREGRRCCYLRFQRC
ncbi:MAG: tRNA (guanosine(46)-N7)-methyltransferase TrmB [Hyphomicrobiaceae bacterium]